MKKILFIIIAIIVSVQVANSQNVQEKDTFNIVNWLKNNNDLYVPYESNIFKSEPVLEMIDDYHVKAYDYKSADKNNDYAIKYTGTDKKENVYWDLDFELDFSFF